MIFGAAGRALSVPLFRRFWIGNSIAMIGRWIYRTTVGWLAWELTHSTEWLGIVAFSDLLPTVILAVGSGAVADRLGFMRIIRLSQVLAMILTVLLAVLIFSGHIGIYSLVAITAGLGVAEALGQPARMAVVNALVPRRELSSAIALGSAAFNASRILGPAIAGGLIIWIGSGLVMLLCTAMVVTFVIVLRNVDVAETKMGRAPAGSLLTEIGSGVVYLVKHRALRFVMILLGAMSLFIRPVMELAPGISGQVFNAGPTGLAIILASIGSGALVASLVMARSGKVQGLVSLLVRSILMMGVTLALAMQFQNIWICAAFLVVMGWFLLSANVSAQTLVQNTVEPVYRARVMSLFMVFAYGLPAIGAIIMGWVSGSIGLQPTIAIGASFMLLFWLWAWPQRKAMAGVLEIDR